MQFFGAHAGVTRRLIPGMGGPKPVVRVCHRKVPGGGGTENRAHRSAYQFPGWLAPYLHERESMRIINKAYRRIGIPMQSHQGQMPILAFSAVVILAIIDAGSVLKGEPPLPEETCRIGRICEAENSRMSGPAVGVSLAGFSGSGYAAGFTSPTDAIEFQVMADTAGRYALEIGYACESGTKIANLKINGSVKAIELATTGRAWKTRARDTINLAVGENVVGLAANWTHFDIDYVKLTPAGRVSPLSKPPKVLADPEAEKKAKSLHAWLIDAYGTTTLSGQQDISEADYVFAKTGKRPAVLGGDFMRYSPTFTSVGGEKKPANMTERYIDSAKAGFLITMMWHWNAPTDLMNGSGDQAWYKGFYTNATRFDLGAALADTNGAKYRLLIADMDSIALELRKFAEAGIPVLWRPLHEAEGKWFWWGAKGPENFKRLWRLMFERYTRHHGLHNLIWVFTSGGDNTWYPGDDVVDIVGYDGYTNNPSDPLTVIWEELKTRFNGRKPLALTEFGGVPDISGMHGFGVRWSYFVSWTGDCCGPRKLPDTANVARYGSAFLKNRSDIDVTAIYASPNSIFRSVPSKMSRASLRGRHWDLRGRITPAPDRKP